MHHEGSPHRPAQPADPGSQLVAIRVSPSPWRWLVLLHPILTTYAVVATGNHFWLDGVAAAIVLAFAFAAERGIAYAYAHARAHQPAPVVAPEPVAAFQPAGD